MKLEFSEAFHKACEADAKKVKKTMPSGRKKRLRRIAAAVFSPFRKYAPIAAESFRETWSGFADTYGKWRVIAAVVSPVVFCMLIGASVLYYSQQPREFDLQTAISEKGIRMGHFESLDTAPAGYLTAAVAADIVSRILEKPGGYMGNDISPLSVFMDNTPSWEKGALGISRDYVAALRNHFARGGTQSKESPLLAEAEIALSFDSGRWAIPSSESAYREAVAKIDQFTSLMTSSNNLHTAIYRRPDNLNGWLSIVENRLGDHVLRLRSSIGKTTLGPYLSELEAANIGAEGSGSQIITIRTPGGEIDNVFYEARGASWALLHFFKAVRHDFQAVISEKGAEEAMHRIISELSACQRPMKSPIVLNGEEFGFLPNHSLILSAHLAKALLGIKDLRTIIDQG